MGETQSTVCNVTRSQLKVYLCLCISCCSSLAWMFQLTETEGPLQIASNGRKKKKNDIVPTEKRAVFRGKRGGNGIGRHFCHGTECSAEVSPLC